MSLHDLTGGIGGGDDKDRHAAEPQKHDRAMAPAQGMKCSMRIQTEVVKVTSDWKRWRRRWHVFFFFVLE